MKRMSLWIFLAVFLPLALGVIYFTIQVRKRSQNIFNEYASGKNLIVTKESGYLLGRGLYQEIPFTLHERWTNRFPFPAITLKLKNHQFELVLCPRDEFTPSGWNITFATATGILENIKTGDAEFDSFMYIASNKKETLPVILTEHRRKIILDVFKKAKVASYAPRRSVMIQIKDGNATYMEAADGGMTSAMAERMNTMLALFTEINEL